VPSRSPARRRHLQVVPRAHPLVASLFPPLSKEEIEVAAERVRLYGQTEPIETLHGAVVSGWQEYRACVEAGVVPSYTTIDEPDDIVEYVVRRNIPRSLSYLDRAVIAVLAQVEWKKLAHERKREGGRVGGLRRVGKLRADSTRSFDGERWHQTAARTLGTKPNLVRQLAQLYRNHPDVFTAVRERRIKIIRVAQELPVRLPDASDRQAILARYEADKSIPFVNLIHDFVREKRVAEVPAGLPRGERYALHAGPMGKTARAILDSSVHLVHVDIAYGDVAMAEETAKIAARILVNGGVYALLAGNDEGPAIMAAVTRHLDYVTIGSLVLVGSSGGPLRRAYSRARRGAWVDRIDSVPVFFFSKGPLTRAISHIAFNGGLLEKKWHRWQKPLPPTLDLVASCVDAGSVVVDLCCGSGTTGEAALKHGCSFVGIDIDAEAIKVASARLAQVERELGKAHGDGGVPGVVKAGWKGTTGSR
jgi:hypothetical protein